MNWKEKYARKAILWLLRFAPQWMIVEAELWDRVNRDNVDLLMENSRIKVSAKQTVSLAEQLVEENKMLHANYERLREDATTIVVEELQDENNRLRRERDDAQNAYCALLEEMEGQL